MNSQRLKNSIEALTDLIDKGGFRLGSKLDYRQALTDARSVLQSVTEHGVGLSEKEIVKVIYLDYMGGSETVKSAIARVIYTAQKSPRSS
jgi:cytochrome P450